MCSVVVNFVWVVYRIVARVVARAVAMVFSRRSVILFRLKARVLNHLFLDNSLETLSPAFLYIP